MVDTWWQCINSNIPSSYVILSTVLYMHRTCTKSHGNCFAVFWSRIIMTDGWLDWMFHRNAQLYWRDNTSPTRVEFICRCKFSCRNKASVCYCWILRLPNYFLLNQSKRCMLWQVSCRVHMYCGKRGSSYKGCPSRVKLEDIWICLVIDNEHMQVPWIFMSIGSCQ
jgi:hypothetical protein